MDQLLPILKDFGFPIALCVALLWAIHKMQGQLVAAYNDRINTLEKIVKELGDKVDHLELDRLRRADEYAHSIKDIAGRYTSAVREHSELTRETLTIMRRLVESINCRPCMWDRYAPNQAQPRVPGADEIPTHPPTDRVAL